MSLEDLAQKHNKIKRTVKESNPIKSKLFDEISIEALQKHGWSSEDCQYWNLTYNLVQDFLKNNPTFVEKFNQDLMRIEELNLQMCLDTRDKSEVIYDFSSTIMAVILGFMKGITTIKDIVEELNTNTNFSAMIKALLPNSLPVSEKYSYSQVCHIMVLFSGKYSPYNNHNDDSFKAPVNVLKDFIMSCNISKSAEESTDFNMYQPNSGFLKGNRFCFTSPRLCTVGFDGQELRATFFPLNGSSNKNYVAVNIINCTTDCSIDFRIRASKNNERSAFLEMIAELQKIYDLSNVIFVCDALNSMPDVVEAIVAAGAHYLLPIKNNQGNKKSRQLIERAFKVSNEEDKIHRFDGETQKEHGRIEKTSVRGINLKDVNKQLITNLGLQDEKLLALHINELEERFASVKSIFTYKKQSEEYRVSYDQEKLKEMNTKAQANKKEQDKRYKTLISDCDLNEPEMFEKILCVMNEWWGYEVYHFKTDENLKQDRLQLSDKLSIATRIGFNRLAMDFCLCVRKKLKEDFCNKSRLPTIKSTYKYLSKPLKFVRELSDMYN